MFQLNLPAERVRVCIVQPTADTVTETFIRAHAEHLPAAVTVVNGFLPVLDGRPLLDTSFASRLTRKIARLLTGHHPHEEVTSAYCQIFRQIRPAVVLAEYGPMGVHVREACRQTGTPLVVHFHGYDASHRGVLERHAAGYRLLFDQAASLVAVSHPMRQKLISLGAPPEKIHYSPYGVDCDSFGGAEPAASPPSLLAVGRFVEKKAPQLTLAAFAEARRSYQSAQLRMIGDGPLLNHCRLIARDLSLGDAVTFLGAQPPAVVRQELRRARAFVQHSIEAPSGDCEGMPVGILEAGASGLPVISTRHAGIPEAVLDGKTGMLVDEGDVNGMAARMHCLLKDADLAGRMGRAGRDHIETHFAQEGAISGLWTILRSCFIPFETHRHKSAMLEGTSS